MITHNQEIAETADRIITISDGKIKEFKRTLVMITHNQEIAETADRIITISDGKIIKDTNDLKENK